MQAPAHADIPQARPVDSALDGEQRLVAPHLAQSGLRLEHEEHGPAIRCEVGVTDQGVLPEPRRIGAYQAVRVEPQPRHLEDPYGRDPRLGKVGGRGDRPDMRKNGESVRQPIESTEEG